MKRLNRPSFDLLLNKRDLVGAEIGVSSGENAFNIMENLDIKKLYLIDPYENYDQFQKQEIHRESAHEKLDKYADKIVWLQKKSEDAILDIKEYLDFIYIDGEHRYEGIKKDIELYVPLVKKDGLVAGHDFEESSVSEAITSTIRGEFIQCCKSRDCDPYDWWYIKSNGEKILSFFENRPFFQELIGKKDLVGIEIGVDSGTNANHICSNLDIKKLYLIDPYSSYNNMSGNGVMPSDEVGVKCYLTAKNILNSFEDKLMWLIGLSEEMYKHVTEMVDFVYIDGNHRYAYVKKDIELYLPLIKEGGLLGGHDFKFGEESDVCRAVIETLHEKYDDLYIAKWDWWCKK